MGEVTQGLDQKFNMVKSRSETSTEVAVKTMMKKDGKNQTEFFDSAYGEYRYLTELNGRENEQHSKYFPRVYNFFEVEEGKIYGIVIEVLKPKFSHGLELYSLIEANKLTEKHKVRYSLELARAISATHKMGIVHGDLKPENVGIADDGSKMGQLKLMDFGLSFNAGDKKGDNKINCCKEKPFGTRHYFSYELIVEIYFLYHLYILLNDCILYLDPL